MDLISRASPFRPLRNRRRYQADDHWRRATAFSCLGRCFASTVFALCLAVVNAHAITDEITGCAVGGTLDDLSASETSSQDRVGTYNIQATGCVFGESDRKPTFNLGGTVARIFILNNTNNDGAPKTTGFNGVRILLGGNTGSPALFTVKAGATSIDSYFAQSIENTFQIPNSAKSEAFSIYLQWSYDGAFYHVKLTKAAGSTSVTVGPVTLGVSQGGTKQAGKAGAQAFGRSMASLASKDHFGRMSNRLEGRQGPSNQAGFLDLADSGWTSISSDDVTSLMAHNAQMQVQGKLDGIDTQSLGFANEFMDATGLQRDALDFYVSGAWGSLERVGAAGYDGYGFTTTTGIDYLFSPEFLLGGSLTYEWGRLEFDQQINGKVVKEGWRGDIYAGWQFDDALSVQGFASYGRFNNAVTANGDKGNTGSERWMTGVKIESKLGAAGLEMTPYALANYMFEDIGSYQTASGGQIAGSSAEFSQGAFGFLLDTQTPVALGLTPYLSLQGEWDWINGGDATLANGAQLTADDWGLTWSTGLQGTITGFAPGTWIGGVLEGSDISVEYSQSSFGRDNASKALAWTWHVPLF